MMSRYPGSARVRSRGSITASGPCPRRAKGPAYRKGQTGGRAVPLNWFAPRRWQVQTCCLSGLSLRGRARRPGAGIRRKLTCTSTGMIIPADPRLGTSAAGSGTTGGSSWAIRSIPTRGTAWSDAGQCDQTAPAQVPASMGAADRHEPGHGRPYGRPAVRRNAGSSNPPGR